MCTKVLCTVVVLAFPTLTRAQSFELDTTWWTTDDEVVAIKEDTARTRVLIGGEFTRVLPPFHSAHGAVVGTVSDVLRPADARPNDRVRCAMPDGAGGWYIGGAFTAVDGALRYRLAHVLADGSLGAWAPVVNGEVNTMVAKGDTMYIGGAFSQVNGQTRVNIAAVRLSTGANVPWGGTANAQVRVLAIDGDDLFVGGDFTQASSQPRGRLAVYSTITHLLSTVWDTDLNGPVHALAFALYGVVVGGDFSAADGLARSNLTCLDRADGAVLALNPGPNDIVRCIQLSGANIYIGGDFTQVGADPRAYLALVHSAGGISSVWVNNMDAPVYSMHLTTNALYVGGQFSRAAGAIRHRAAAFRRQGDGVAPWLLPWAPAGNGTVRCLEQQGADLYIGGGFDTLGVTRPHVAILDELTGTPLAWNVGTNERVNAVTVGATHTFVVGSFDSLMTTGVVRSKMFAFENASGEPSAWSTVLNGQVNDVALHGGKVYVCGVFSQATGQPRTGFAAFDAASATLDPLDPQCTGVRKFLVRGDTLYMGGTFYYVQGVLRPCLAALLLPTGALAPFDAMINVNHIGDAVEHLVIKDERIYFTGRFAGVSGSGREDAAAVRTGTGEVLIWQPDATGYSAPLAFTGRTISLVNRNAANTQTELRAFDPVDGGIASAALVLNNAANELIALADGDLLMGGRFTEVGGRAVRHFARVNVTPTLRIRAFLQGPFDTGSRLMGNNLSQIQAMPLQEPYTAMGYVHTGGGGGETASTAIYGGLGATGIVDWVVVELRDPTDPSLIVASRSALLRCDGLVVDHTQAPLRPFGPDPDGTYHVAIRHRNHLGAMTGNPLAIGQNALADFAAGGADTFGTDAVWSGPFYSLLWSGDANFDGTIKYTGSTNDRDPILLAIGGSVPTNTAIGYFNADITMNGVVKYTGSLNDRDPLLVNTGGSVPTSVRHDPLP